jgi:hypothetical protein
VQKIQDSTDRGAHQRVLPSPYNRLLSSTPTIDISYGRASLWLLTSHPYCRILWQLFPAYPESSHKLIRLKIYIKVYRHNMLAIPKFEGRTVIARSLPVFATTAVTEVGRVSIVNPTKNPC